MNTTARRRIRIYISIKRSLEQAKKIYEKHKAEGAGSILSSMEGFNWESTGPKINFCLEKHKEAMSLIKMAEEIYRQRDAVLAEIVDITRVSKSILKNEFTCNPDVLGEWGIVLYDEEAAKKNIPP